MTKQEIIKANLKPKGIYNLTFIEENTGLRKFKLYEFLNNKAKLSNEEAATVLGFIRNATKLQK